MDFFVKTTGKSDARGDVVDYLPLPAQQVAPSLSRRLLRLVCLTTHYRDLWRAVFDDAAQKDAWSKPDPRLDDWSRLAPTWTRASALRTPFARRQALVELDALAAISLGLTADELCLLYRVQFPVLQQYERETFYDRRGRIVFTSNRGLPGVGLSRDEWNEIRHAEAGSALPEWAADGRGPYVPPFDRCDREDDMRQAYAFFAASLAATADPPEAAR